MSMHIQFLEFLRKKLRCTHFPHILRILLVFFTFSWDTGDCCPESAPEDMGETSEDVVSSIFSRFPTHRTSAPTLASLSTPVTTQKSITPGTETTRSLAVLAGFMNIWACIIQEQTHQYQRSLVFLDIQGEQLSNQRKSSHYPVKTSSLPAITW